MSRSGKEGPFWLVGRLRIMRDTSSSLSDVEVSQHGGRDLMREACLQATGYGQPTAKQRACVKGMWVGI